jgi:cyclophilin family peptidyl-prolyl cis-trans isomerase
MPPRIFAGGDAMFRRFIVGVAAVSLIAGAAVLAQGKKNAPVKKNSEPKAAAAPAGPVLVFNFVRGLGSSKQVLGPVEIETFPAEAPKSVAHVADLVKSHFYNGIRVHFVSPTGALIQFGDPTSKDMTKKDQWGTGGSDKPVGVAEASMAKHKFERGIVGLAYRNGYDPKTADSQLVVIKGSNSAMNGKYAVIGKVLDDKSLKVVDKLEVGDRIESSSVK